MEIWWIIRARFFHFRKSLVVICTDQVGDNYIVINYLASEKQKEKSTQQIQSLCIFCINYLSYTEDKHDNITKKSLSLCSNTI